MGVGHKIVKEFVELYATGVAELPLRNNFHVDLKGK